MPKEARVGSIQEYSKCLRHAESAVKGAPTITDFLGISHVQVILCLTILIIWLRSGPSHYFLYGNRQRLEKRRESKTFNSKHIITGI